ncbi:MAG: hypothetical protein Q7J31_00080, partial [Syntrophales bacterium]|nr:hypothetical protein [Syntrophales bacterium]
LNRRRPPWQGGTLPLSYARTVFGGDYNKYCLFVNMNFDDAVVYKLIVFYFLRELEYYFLLAER